MARVEIAGSISPRMVTRLTRCAERTLDFLGSQAVLRIEITDPPDQPEHHEAGARSDGVWLRPSVLEHPERAEFILYEEIAHDQLRRLGVPHGDLFMDNFIHELFATWIQVKLFATSSRHSFTTTPVPSDLHPRHPELGYHLGKHLGAALAGSTANARRLETWRSDPATDPELATIIFGIAAELEGGTSPDELSALLLELYEALRAGADGEWRHAGG